MHENTASHAPGPDWDRFADCLPCTLFQGAIGADGAFALSWIGGQAQAMFGLPSAALLADPARLRTALHPDDLDGFAASLRRAALASQPWQAEFRVRLPEGGLRWLEGQALPQPSPAGTLWHGVFTDVTERMRRQHGLDTHLEANRLLLESLAEGVVVCDAQGRLVLFNDAARNWFSDGSVDLPRGQWEQHFVLYRPDSLEPIPTPEWPLIQALTGRHVREMEFIVAAHGLRQRYVTANAQPLHGPDGALLGAIVVMHDITERKQVELRQREFVSTVSHELRTPLTSISGSLGLLRGGALGEVPEAMRSMVDIAHQNSLRLSHLINDLLDMDKLAAGKMQFDLRPHALAVLLEESLRSNEAYAQQHGVRLALEGVPALEVRTDAMRLQQVLANFLSNAIKFSPPGAQVEVSCTLRDARVRIAVRDHGSGIPEDFRARIFQKFSQLDSSDRRQKGGTGLGLAISKELVERMGGLIGFDSVEGEGATFWCELPVHGGAAAAPAREGAAGLPVLVVEDEPDIARLLRMLLEHAGYRVASAASLAEAKERLAQEAFAAVTIDLELPDGNGAELVRELRDAPATQGLPILVISAYNDAGRLMLDGCFEALDWLDKPIDPDLLVAALNRMVRAGAHRPRILHVEDDADLCRVIGRQVQALADLVPAGNLAQARELLLAQRFDLLLLDLMLPDGNGLVLLDELQCSDRAMPVVVLSAQDLPLGQAGKIHAVCAKSRTEPRQLLQLLHELLQQEQGKGEHACWN